MKKTLIILIGISCILNSCKKETPEITTISTEHKSLLIDFTATWCCPCGDASPIYKDIMRKYPNKLVFFSMHAGSGDPFHNQTMYSRFSNMYNVSSIPQFIGDNTTVGWGYVLPDLHLDTSHFYEIIKNTLSQNPPACGIGITKSIEGSTMTIKTKTVFFKETTGKLSLAVYVTEDGLYYDQQCSTDDIHNNVFRDCVSDANGTGTLLSSATANKGITFDNEFKYNIPASYIKENLHVIAVVYQLGATATAKPLAILNVNKI